MSLLNTEKWLSKPRIIAGVMTGTSLDAIDVAIVRFYQKNGRLKLSLVASGEYSIDQKMRNQILKMIKNGGSAKDFSQLAYALPEIYATCIGRTLKSKRLTYDEVDAIGIHGQTIWHQPNYDEFGGQHLRSTFQIGNGSVLAVHTGKPVVSDFRAADVAAGGQGAPLVPIFDSEFLSDPDKDVIALNIGGISNITYLPKGAGKSKIVAFDTGPGNMLIDIAMQKFFSLQYDKDGSTAQRGWNIQLLYDYLMGDEYIRSKPPKSTGREKYGVLLKEIFASEMFKKLNSKPEDLIRTLTDFTVGSIVENIKLYANPEARIIVSGGGTNNKFMMMQLQRSLPDAELITSDKAGIPSSQKEAICFAYLAYRTLGGMTSNIPRSTGAKRDQILGSISLP
jgi:anhydro-N-acetylmuramic acid kinase